MYKCKGNKEIDNESNACSLINRNAEVVLAKPIHAKIKMGT